MTKQHEKAQAGLKQIQDAILEHLENHPEGSSNKEVADALGLLSDYEGANKNFLTWSIFGILVKEDRVCYELRGNRRIYFKK